MTTTAQRDQEAQWSQGQAKKQPRKLWAVESVKDEMTPAEWAHMIKAVKDTRAVFDGQRSEFAGTVIDCARSSDFGMAAKISAAKRLSILKMHALIETHDPGAAQVTEMLLRMSTLVEIAAAFGHYRKRGPDREQEPDTRKVREPVLHIVTAIAGFYENGESARGWRGASYGPLDLLDQIEDKGVVL